MNFPKGKAHFADDNCEETVYEPTTDDNASPTDEPVVPEQVNKEELSAARYKTTLLVVEDNPDIRQYIVSLFQNKYNVLDVGCGRGGDIGKFAHTDIKTYVGIDIDNNGVITGLS